VRSDILTLNLHVAVRDVSPAQERDVHGAKAARRDLADFNRSLIARQELRASDELLEVAKHGCSAFKPPLWVILPRPAA
jgi:hypothetical protein